MTSFFFFLLFPIHLHFFLTLQLFTLLFHVLFSTIFQVFIPIFPCLEAVNICEWFRCIIIFFIHPYAIVTTCPSSLVFFTMCIEICPNSSVQLGANGIT
jgi:hypothetical protein